MFRDTSKCFESFSSFGESVSWRNRDTNEREIAKVSSPCQAQMKSPKNLPPSAFKVYDRVLEKHRYVPRKWTQEEFEAALPERFKGKTTVNNYDLTVSRKTPDFDIDLYTTDELDFYSNEKVKELTSGESTHQPYSSNPRKKAEIKQKIKNLKAIFEKAGNPNVEIEADDTMDKLENFQTEYKGGKIDGTEIEELERCKNSEAKVKLIEEEDTAENPNGVDENAETVNEVLEKETTIICDNKYSSFLDACLRCLFNIEPFVEILSNVSSIPENCSSPTMVKLKNLIHYASSTESGGQFSQLVYEDVFSEFYDKISERVSCDEVLEMFLETLIQEMQQATGDDENILRSLIQGKFCHLKTCDRCTSVTKDSEPFLFLNPTTPARNSPNYSVLDINFLSCGAESVWHITTRQIVIKPGMMVVDLKQELLNCPEFYTSGCDCSSIRIGEVNESRLVKTFEDEDDLSTIKLKSTSSLFAFHLLHFHHVPEDANTLSGTAMSYHLYFNCGLCLSDGKEVGLFVHKNCGGMVCRDCLDVITQSYQDWELCPCPICERPIDLDKELCKARMSGTGASKEINPPTESYLLCEIMFRADKPIDGGTELIGCPLIVSLPQQVTGCHLYRCIGYLLPNALPMKDRTSFTLHTVDKSGLRCPTCSLDSCHGCLIRIDDNVRITRNTNLVVHFDDLAEESKKSFGIQNPDLHPASNSQGLFDGILQSCVRASTSEKMVCLECYTACKVSSSIAEFPQLLLIHLNQLYADKGLPPITTVADVSRFLVLQHGNESTKKTKDDLTYQLTAVVLADESSATPSYKASVPGFANDTWMLYEESHVSEIDPYQLHLTKNSVLFYQPVKNPPSDPPKVGHVLQMPLLGNTRREGATEVKDPYYPGNNIYGTKLATISEETAAANYPKHIMDWKKATRKRNIYDRHLEPGECFLGTGLGLHGDQGLLKPDVYSSQLSLGEIYHAGIAARMSVDLDGISPISAQEIWKSDSKLVRETKKLVRAVKREDAYGIVCSLKRGANPCLLINDVTALHLAAGIKSDQRCSMVAYLLKYSHDVNVPTGDGTTPVHVAAAWGHQDVLELLLAHGGDAFNVTDQEGNSAFDLAAKDCSSFLQLLDNSPGSLEPSTSSRTSLGNPGLPKTRRLEDIVRSNVTLPSFVNEEDTTRSRLRLRWLKRFQSFRNKSTGVLRSLKRMSSIRRRSRIGVMATKTQEQNDAEKL